MATDEEISQLIEKAAEALGSQTRLAEVIGMPKSHITQMKQGKRHVNWRVRGKLRAVLGEDPAHAFVAAMLEDLDDSENEDEKKAAEGLKAMLAAFPNDWRRLYLKDRLRPVLRAIVGLRLLVHKTLYNGLRHSKALTYTLQGI